MNTLAVLVLAIVVWRGVNTVSDAWSALRHARDADRWLISFSTEVDRIQSLVHRYFTHPTEPVLAEIDQRRDALLGRLGEVKRWNSSASDETELVVTVQRLFGGFDELRSSRDSIGHIYEQQVVKPAREMAGLYSMIESAMPAGSSLIAPALGRSREAFSTALVSVNAFYLSQDVKSASDTRENLKLIERTAPVMIDLAETDLQRNGLSVLHARATQLLQGFDRLASGFTHQAELLKTAFDANQAAMASVIDRMFSRARGDEQAAQNRFDQALFDVFTQVGFAGLGFMAVSILLSVGTSRSISLPLSQLRAVMNDIVEGRYDSRVPGLSARDEIGDMARAVEIFRDNAIHKRQVEDALRAAKEGAETALAQLKETQASLIEAEKLAALGALVAGVAHEVNNPVGVSLTVASSLARRCDAIEAAMAEGPLRRSVFTTFLADNREAANQLVANLQRASDLVQAFKQVAVDRSHADRRRFDLAETTGQIMASLLPAVRKSRLQVDLRIPEGLWLDSYPGPYGQVITNLFLNCTNHAFRDGETGTVRIEAVPRPDGQVCITFADDGRGMSPEVLRRVFEPFFTTRRGEGGTGLGLHIVYNLVTHQLGGRITVESAPGDGTRFHIILPNVAPNRPGSQTVAALPGPSPAKLLAS